jgi:hypothetical protein
MNKEWTRLGSFEISTITALALLLAEDNSHTTTKDLASSFIRLGILNNSLKNSPQILFDVDQLASLIFSNVACIVCCKS